MASIDLGRRVFMVFQVTTTEVQPVGTAFGIERPGLVLTARHVVEGKQEASLRLCCTSYRPLVHKRIDHIVSHPEADIAALVLEPDDRLDHFDIGTPEKGFAEFPLGEGVASYGFPSVKEQVQPRFMKGHIQRHFRNRDHGYDYRAFELAFPAFPGQSGSPVFKDSNRQEVVGLVTASTSYFSTKRDSGQLTAAGFWAIGASITPLSEWVRTID